MTDPNVFAVTMGFDAFRIAIGRKPKNHSLEDIVRWLTIMARQAQS